MVTGIGALTPIGHGADGLWAGVQRGESAVRLLTRFDPTPFRSHLAAEIDEIPVDAIVDPRRARRLDRFSLMAVVSAVQAINDAGLDIDTRLALQMGCYLGSALGGVAFGETQHQNYLRGGPHAVSPALALSVFGAAGSSNVALQLGLRGASIANSNSCASGAIAIGEAFRVIRAGECEVTLAGGSEAPLAPLTFGSFALVRAMSTANDDPRHASRPFDARRDGFVMGEGAAMLVLESYEHARERKARVYAEVRGYATTNDAFDMLAPRADGSEVARCVRLALADAGVVPAEVEYVNAHASSTPIGDRAEARALFDVLGDEVPVSGTKGLYGHPLGASGAIEAAICALAICCGFVPGTVNLEAPEAECRLNLVSPGSLRHRPRVVVSTSCGFGGINAVLVLSAP